MYFGIKFSDNLRIKFVCFGELVVGVGELFDLNWIDDVNGKLFFKGGCSDIGFIVVSGFYNDFVNFELINGFECFMYVIGGIRDGKMVFFFMDEDV